LINTPHSLNGATSTAIVTTSPPEKLAVIEEMRTETKHQSEYERYLQSPRWRTLARAVCMRARGKCEICRRADGIEYAHLTYERIFHEPIDDLLWVCKKCHRQLDHSRQ
jgi:uncharacterized protein YlaI